MNFTGNIVGIGTDLCDCVRIANMIEKHGEEFVNRVYTPREIEYCGVRKAAVQHYAGRWAAKEAILKALGTGWTQGIKWTDLEVTNQPGGEPIVQLHNIALQVMRSKRIERVLISISHTETQAIAFAVAVAASTELLD
jgi:holo-[acyl-carrier protein] synthase